MIEKMLPLIKPNWIAPDNIIAFCTTRDGGFSNAPYNSFNLATHTGDDPSAVALNRKQLVQQTAIPKQPVWLSQIHGTEVVELYEHINNNITADASTTSTKNIVCGVMTADCLPLLICNSAGNQVAAVHAGWRGLAAGIINHTITKFHSPSSELIVWIGPSICQTHFEVGNDVYQAFSQQASFKEAFQAVDDNKWLADMAYLAKLQLDRLEVQHCYCAELCTFCRASEFFSYRRDGQTGRMVSAICSV